MTLELSECFESLMHEVTIFFSYNIVQSIHLIFSFCLCILVDLINAVKTSKSPPQV